MFSPAMTTQECILSAACAEFLEKGYQGAGLRDIARRANVTTGALYGYFKNKEDLFEALVKPCYDQVMTLYRSQLAKFSAIPAEKQWASMRSYSADGIRLMCDYMYAHHDAFKLILCCSEGTEYNHLVHEMAILDVEANHAFYQAANQAGKPIQPINPTLEHMLTSGMFSTFFELIVHDIPQEQAEEYLTQMLNFYTGGWAQIMGLD